MEFKVKHRALVFLLCLCLTPLLNAQKKPDSKPTSQPSKSEKERKRLQRLDLVVPEMKNPKDVGEGVKWDYIRKAKKKRKRVRLGDRVKIHVTLFDQKEKKELMSTRKRPTKGQPKGKLAQLNVGGTTPGLDRVLPLLNVGDKARVDVPSKMAFGEAGINIVKPNTDLIYIVEIHDIVSHVDIPERPKWDQEKAQKIDEKIDYIFYKDGKGPLAGEFGIVVYDYMMFSEFGDIVDFSKFREYAVMAGQANSMHSKYQSTFSPLARAGAEFIVKMDISHMPKNRQPFALRGSKDLYFLLMARWVVPFEPSTENMKVTKTGLKYEIIEAGEGPAIKDTHHVKIHYAWWTKDGKLIESSYARGTTNTLRQIALPAGMVEGLHLLRPGGKARLYVPSALAFGERGRKDCPPNTDVIMKIELFESKQLDPLPKKKKTSEDKDDKKK